MKRAFEGKVVVITGASAGVGRATARVFAEQGASIALIARGADGLEAAAREIEAFGGIALILPTDVADQSQVERAAERIEHELGPIDIWINNAMVSVFSPVKEMRPEEFKRVTDVTYLGYVFGAMNALKYMLPRDRGMIIQVGSALAYRGIPLQSAYCAAKHAIKGFTESLRVELMHDKSKVRVCMIELPAVNTPQFTWSKSRMPRDPKPVLPIYRPETIAHAIAWLAQHPRRELDVGMSTVRAILAEKIAPWAADWYLSKKGYDLQMTDHLAEQGRRDNLFSPVPGDHGAHGPFKRLERQRSPQLWIAQHRALVAGLFAIGIGAILASRPRMAERELFDIKEPFDGHERENRAS